MTKFTCSMKSPCWWSAATCWETPRIAGQEFVLGRRTPGKTGSYLFWKYKYVCIYVRIMYVKYTRTWKSVHMWNQGKNCMGRRAFRKSNKSMQPGLKLHGTHYVEVLLLDPWQCTFLLANFPNPHQDACAQLCPIILKYMLKFLNPHQDACAQLCPTILKIYIHGC